MQQPAAHRVRSLVDEPDRRLDVGHRPRRLVEPGDPGEGGEEIDAVPPGALLGVADLVPELDGALVVGHRLGERVGRLRGGRRPDRPLERARQVVRGVPVEGELGRMGRFRAGARLERPRERGVQAGALPRQQVVVHRLLEQGVAECVALAARRRVGDEHLAADALRAAPRTWRRRRGPRRRRAGMDPPAWPAAEAIRRNSWVGSARSAIRPSSTSRSVEGSSALPSSPAAASSSSAKNALPPDRAWIDSSSVRSRSRPAIARSWSADSRASNGTSSSRSTRPDRSSSARNGSSGCRRWSSSERYVSRSRTGASRRLRMRNPTRSRVERSDQWRSSTTRTTGAVSASRSSTPSSISNSRACAQSMLGPGTTLPGSLARSGTSLASSDRPGPMTDSSTSGSVRLRRPRSASAIGANGSEPSPTTTQPPLSTTAPSASARSPSAATSRVLPTPASPATSTALARPSLASRSAARSRSSSWDRPMSTGLETRDAMSRIMGLSVDMTSPRRRGNGSSRPVGARPSTRPPTVRPGQPGTGAAWSSP